MKCAHLAVRTKNYDKYLYCRKLKKKINYSDCNNCECKNVKNQKIKVKSHKVSRQAKACEIKSKVKDIVYERDNHRCIFCGKYVEKRNACCHFIPRSQGGLGIEENIFAACEDCHREQDNGKNTKLYDKRAKSYLKSKYKGWNIEKLIYKKY